MSGSSLDTISLDAFASFNGNNAPAFLVLVDGKQIGTGTINSNNLESLSFSSAIANGQPHTVSIVYTNHMSSSELLTVQDIVVDGQRISSSDPSEEYVSPNGNYKSWGQMYFGGQVNFVVPATAFTAVTEPGTPTPTGPGTGTTTGIGATPTPVTLGSGPDTLALSVSEDAYQGDAQFTISVDGVQQGGVQTVTANHSAGQSQTFNVEGTFGTTPHTVAVNFLNDAYDGTASTDRNLYVTGASLDGTSLPGVALNEYSSGAQTFSFGTASTPTPTPTPTAPATPTPTGSAYYVSATGSNRGNGTATSPFATLQYAVKQMEATNVHTLYVENGTYSVASTIALTAADNADTILAAPGATPVLNAVGGTSTIVSLTGAQGVSISGLTFTNASADPQGAALTLNGANGNTITGNTFTNNSEAVLLEGASSNTVASNTMLNSATSAVELKDGSNLDTLTNNVINGVGGTNVSGAAFYGHGIANDTFSNNLIQNTAGAGIAIEDFGFGNTLNSGITITENKLINTSTSTTSTDDGAIYILGRSDADLHSTISANFISGVGNVNPNAHVEGIYLDDNTSGVAVTGNIVRGVQSDDVELHGGYNDTFTNNIFDLGSSTRTVALIQQPESDHPATVQAGLTDDSFSNNIIVSQQANPYYVYVYFDPEAVNVPVSNNLYYDAAIPAGGLPDNYGVYFYPNTPAGGLPMVPPISDSTPSVGNPKFSSPATGDYSIQAGSAASLIGFVPINQALIGPH